MTSHQLAAILVAFTVITAAGRGATAASVPSSFCSSPNTFKCASGFGCIQIIYRCDGITDCVDGSDERDCSIRHRPCSAGQAQCLGGSCIATSKVCDGQPDCPDASDEDPMKCSSNRAIMTLKPTATPCAVESFHCRSGECIPNRWLCDGHLDCVSREDEHPDVCDDKATDRANSSHTKGSLAGTASTSNTGPTTAATSAPHSSQLIQTSTAGCPNEFYTCLDEQATCIGRDLVCNRVPDCPDGSDESAELCRTAPITDKTCALRCDDRCIPAAWLCDGVAHCTNLSDEDPESCHQLLRSDPAGSLLAVHEATQPLCGPDMFRCLDATVCVPVVAVCDGQLHCPDGSDEGDCSQGSQLQWQSLASHCPPTWHRCSQDSAQQQLISCLHPALQCNGVADCKDGSDEAFLLCGGSLKQQTTPGLIRTQDPADLSRWDQDFLALTEPWIFWVCVISAAGIVLALVQHCCI